ncbi:protease complex subunit PrcB family protein [Deinococcus multiflagellatus]|uniref:Protease complex subunit PrcB family protein n=1 Tax=Deinococcus multiflagellatus TaxID=1656887 RepID=A0ABW1ZFD0_9DEIO|nr:protease complex subunit PrcB family protein [Deinococcus multiflagellatus]MBZ9712903.1 protease complex subunit PrcB family protein [Deinococcus multiflagellatus]
MKRILPVVLPLTAGLLSACTMTGPGNLRVHEALLYGGTQERVVWVYGTAQGGQSSVKIGNTPVDLRAQGTGNLALSGTLSVNGGATYRLPTTPMTQKLSVTRAASGLFTVSPQPGAALSAVYYTDGRTWTKLAGVQGTVAGTPVDGLAGAGRLTADEARALGRELLNQGPLAVAVLDERSLPDAPLTIEPAPSEYLRTGLYILPNVPQASTPTSPTPGTPTGGARVTFTEVASGTNATATAFSAQLATTSAAALNLYAQAYGRQTGAPTPPSLSGNTLVGVFLGQRPTGGYTVKVTGVAASGSTLTVTVRVTAPSGFATQAITSPWTMVRVPGTYTRVTVVDEQGQPLQGGGESR